MNTSLLSIIIPCYNDFKYIEQSVNSALKQTYQNKEVIVVDDGSNLKTKKVLKKLEIQLTKLITQENQGQSTARNVGIREAKGEYILVLDSDDFFEETFCEKAIKILSNDKEVKLVSCYAVLLYEDGKSSVYKHHGGNIENFLFENNAMGSALFKKKDWENCGNYDENMKDGFEDWEFYIRLLKNGGNAFIISEPLYTYRKRTDSTTIKATSLKYNLQKYIFVKHQELYKQHYSELVDYLISNAKREEKEKIKNTQRLEFKIGKKILTPLRWIKSLFR